jgi:cytochrome c553
MTSANGKTPVAVPSAAPAVPTSESNRTKSIATRLTDAEFAEIESAAGSAGKKVAEWLREAALAQTRATGEEKTTDTVLLAELMALRSLIVNLFAVASKGPLSDETLRRIAAYADAIKDQKAEELLARKQVSKTPESGEKQP